LLLPLLVFCLFLALLYYTIALVLKQKDYTPFASCIAKS
jgi:hypothetical protein